MIQIINAHFVLISMQKNQILLDYFVIKKLILSIHANFGFVEIAFIKNFIMGQMKYVQIAKNLKLIFPN